MKKSDIFNSKQQTGKVRNRLASLVMVLLLSTATMAQDFIFMEGSVHSFSVDLQAGHNYEWRLNDDSFNELGAAFVDFIDGQFDAEVTLRFIDRDRQSSQWLYVTVTDVNETGCTTTRAVSIDLQPNNMFLEFAAAEAQDCFNMGDYYAPLKVGLNFLDKAAGVAIPEDRFPLQVTYEISNITDGVAGIAGNNGLPLTLEYSAENDYYLLVTEAVGELTRTVEYELLITSVVDKYETVINNNEGDIRLQIRVINHLPQNGSMDMALAYVVTPINYMGAY